MANTIYEILVKLEGDQKAKKGLEGIAKASGLAGAALTAFTVKAASETRKYTDDLANLATVSDETTGSTEDLNKAFGVLSNDLDGAISKAEAATASYDVLSAGYKDQADLLFILQESQKTAIGGLSDLGTVSDATTSILNAYGDALGENLSIQEKTIKIQDILVRTQFDGKTTVDELASSIGRLTPVAAANNISLEELGGSLAVITAGGIQTRQAVTGLQAGIANIIKPTQSAVEEAERLGIQFNQASLQAKGFEQFLLDIITAEDFTSESLSKLFSSVEGLNAITSLTADNGQKLVKAIESQGNAAGTQLEAFNAKANTDLQQFNNTLNKLNNALIDIGQGSLIALSPFVELLAKAADVFSKLSPETKQFIGVLAGVSGVALTANAAILLLSTQVVGLATNISAVSKFITVKFIPSLVKLATTSSASSISIATLTASTKAFVIAAAPFIAAVAAVAGAAELLRRDINNANTELKNLELRGLQVETQKLADKATQLGIRIRDTGEAIPDEEFNRYIRVLEDANQGNGTLTQIIDVLKRKQEEAKNATEESTNSTKENTMATGENTVATKEDADAKETAKEKYEEYSQAVRDSISNLASELSLTTDQLSSFSSSEEETLNKSLAAYQDNIPKQIALLEDLKNQSLTTARERTSIEIEQDSLRFSLLKKEKETVDRLKELNQEKVDNLLETNKAILEAEEAVSGEANLKRREKLIREEFNLKKKAINDELALVKKASVEESTLLKDKAQLETQLTKDLINLDKERVQKRIALIQDALDREVTGLNDLRDAYTNQSSILDSQLSNLDQVSSLTDKIFQSLRNQNLTLDQGNSILAITKEFFGEQFDINNSLQSFEEIRNRQELAKLQIKQQQLEIDREQLKIANEITQLELQAKKEELTAKLSDNTLTGPQRENIERQINTTERRSAFEQRKTDAALESNELSQNINKFTQRLESIISGQSAPSSNRGRGNRGSNKSSGSGSLSQAGNVIELKGADKIAKATEDSAKASRMVAQSSDGNKDKLAEINIALDRQNKNSNSTNKTLIMNLSNIDTNVGTIARTVNNINRKLDGISRNLTTKRES